MLCFSSLVFVCWSWLAEVSAVASLQEGYEFNSHPGFSAWSFHVLAVSASGSLPSAPTSSHIPTLNFP